MGERGLSLQQIEGTGWVHPDVQNTLALAWEEIYHCPYTPEIAAELIGLAADDKVVAVLGRDDGGQPSSLVVALLPTLLMWPDPSIIVVWSRGALSALWSSLDMTVDILRGKGYTKVRTAAPPARALTYERFGKKYGPSRMLGTMLEWEIA